MNKNLRNTWEEIKENKLCITSFAVALISSCPILFNNLFYIERKVIYIISMAIYFCTLFKPNLIYKHFKSCP